MSRLLSCLALAAVMLAGSRGQTRAGIIGFVNKTLTNGLNYLSNPLRATNETLSAIIPTTPENTKAYLWDPTNQVFRLGAVYSAGRWDVPTLTIPGGAGFVLEVDAVHTITFVGEVRQGSLSTPIAGSNLFSFVGSQVPQAGALSSVLGFTATDGDQVCLFRDGAQPGSDVFSYFDGFGWYDPAVLAAHEPVLDMAEACFIQHPGPETNWVRVFKKSLAPAPSPSDSAIQGLMLRGGSVNFVTCQSARLTNSLTAQPVTAADGVRLALYCAPAGSIHFEQIGASVAAGLPLPGTWAGGTRLTGTNAPAGTVAQFQVRAWESAYGTNYEQAVAAPPAGGRRALRGESPVVLGRTGDPSAWPPAPPPSLISMGLTGFAVFANRPPFMEPVSAGTMQNSNLVLALPKLLSRASDPDGDAVTIVAVTFSTNGAAVRLGNSSMTYVPRQDFSGWDRFLFVLSDGWDGFYTNSVDVSVTAGGGVTYVPGTPRLAESNFTVTFAGIPGQAFSVEWAQSAEGPWTKLGNYTARSTPPGIGTLVVVDPVELGTPARFYRTVYPAY